MNAKKLVVPKTNPNDDEVEIVHWYVKEGTKVKAGENVLDIATTKAVVALQANASGYIHFTKQVGEIAKINETLAEITSQKMAHRDSKQATKESRGTRFSKSAKQMLDSRKIPETQFQNQGLITASRLQELLGETEQVISPSNLRVEKLDPAKRTEVRALSAGQSDVSSSLTIQFNATQLNDAVKKQPKLGGQLLPLILFEFSKTLEKHPKLTAYFEQGAIVYYDRIHLGLAFDFGQGLRVVTIPDANTLSAEEIYEKITSMGLDYQRGSLRPEQMQGSTITISDLSGQSINHFQPLINHNQSAVLGIGGSQSESQRTISLTLVFDHRVTTGSEIAQVLNSLRKRLEAYV